MFTNIKDWFLFCINIGFVFHGVFNFIIIRSVSNFRFESLYLFNAMSNMLKIHSLRILKQLIFRNITFHILLWNSKKNRIKEFDLHSSLQSYKHINISISEILLKSCGNHFFIIFLIKLNQNRRDWQYILKMMQY